MHFSRRVMLLAFNVCFVVSNQRSAMSSKERRSSPEIARFPTWSPSSVKRRSASFRSLVLSERRNCLSVLLSKA